MPPAGSTPPSTSEGAESKNVPAGQPEGPESPSSKSGQAAAPSSETASKAETTEIYLYEVELPGGEQKKDIDVEGNIKRKPDQFRVVGCDRGVRPLPAGAQVERTVDEGKTWQSNCTILS